MMDIDDLLPHFVVERVINFNQKEEISRLSDPQDKVQRLLLIISGHLEAGNTTGFYSMIRIMRNHGEATRSLADHMITSVRL